MPLQPVSFLHAGYILRVQREVAQQHIHIIRFHLLPGCPGTFKRLQLIIDGTKGRLILRSDEAGQPHRFQLLPARLQRKIRRLQVGHIQASRAEPQALPLKGDLLRAVQINGPLFLRQGDKISLHAALGHTAVQGLRVLIARYQKYRHVRRHAVQQLKKGRVIAIFADHIPRQADGVITLQADLLIQPLLPLAEMAAMQVADMQDSKTLIALVHAGYAHLQLLQADLAVVDRVEAQDNTRRQ
ncbi:hypothetical protein SDC9_119588 [bioreactor metagenome]|uniref:Uncharacterized protein n=1 Tax=bioreactor metagenome TaxID=1076179 RepID=A0A645C4N9_9ZZZZ